MLANPSGRLQFLAQNRVHAFHHVLHDFRRRVPDAQFLAQFRVKGFQERLVEILHRVRFLELVKKRAAVNAVQNQRRPIQHFRELEGFEFLRVGHQMEEFGDHRHAQITRRGVPVEARLGSGWVLLGPQHPGGEDAVKESLNQAGTEEVLAFLALELQAQGFFQRRAHGRQCGEFHTLKARLDHPEHKKPETTQHLPARLTGQRAA